MLNLWMYPDPPSTTVWTKAADGFLMFLLDARLYATSPLEVNWTCETQKSGAGLTEVVLPYRKPWILTI